MREHFIKCPNGQVSCLNDLINSGQYSVGRMGANVYEVDRDLCAYINTTRVNAHFYSIPNSKEWEYFLFIVAGRREKW